MVAITGAGGTLGAALSRRFATLPMDAVTLSAGGDRPLLAAYALALTLPQALVFLIGYGKEFQPMITLGEYSSLFLAVIIGLGVIFELPILVFFLSLMGIVTAGWSVGCTGTFCSRSTRTASITCTSPAPMAPLPRCSPAAPCRIRRAAG